MSALIYTVFATREDARAVASQLLDERLIACANVIGRIKSLFEWDGERGEGEHTPHQKLSHPEKAGDILHRLAFLMQPLEGFILLHLGGRQASDILDDGRCKGRCFIRLGHDGARNERRLAGLLRDFLQGKEAAASGNDAIMLALTAHQQSLANAACFYGR